MSITCFDSDGNVLKTLYQWDHNQTITVQGLDTVPVFHFCNRKSDIALVVNPTVSGTSVVVDIPNILLQQAEPIIAYLYEYTENEGYRTTHAIHIPVIPRPRPDDYEYEETVSYVSIAIINSKLNNLIMQTTNGSQGNQSLEIIDMRNSYDGIVYNTAGEAVRAIGEKIDEYVNPIEKIADYAGYIGTASGLFTAYNNCKTTVFRIERGKTYIVKSTGNRCVISFGDNSALSGGDKTYNIIDNSDESTVSKWNKVENNTAFQYMYVQSHNSNGSGDAYVAEVSLTLKQISGIVSDETSETVDISNCDIRVQSSVSATTGSITTGSSAEKTTTIVSFIPVCVGTVVKKGGLRAYVSFYTDAKNGAYMSSYSEASSINDYIAEHDGYVRITAWAPDELVAPTSAQIVSSIRVIYPHTIKNAMNTLVEVIGSNSIIDNKFVWRNTGVVDTSRYYSMTQRIDVDSGKDYYFWITHDGSGAYCTIFAYDANGNYVTSGYNMTGVSDNTSYCSLTLSNSGSQTTDFNIFRFASGIKSIAILFDKYATVSLSMKTFFSADYIARQEISRIREDISGLSDRCYTNEKSNPVCVDEFLSVAGSYVNRYYTSGNSTKYYMSYGFNTVLSNQYNGKGGIDCSSYVGLVLRGIPFEETEYNTDGVSVNDPEEVEDDGTDVEELDVTEYTYDANPDYDWSINPYKYELPFVLYGHEDDMRQVRTASQLGQWMQLMGRSVWIDKHLANLLPGDIVFFAKQYSNGRWIQEQRYMNISHVAIVKSKELAPQNADWNTELYPYKHTIYEVSGQHAGACGEFVLEAANRTGMTKNGVDTLVLVCRPDLGRITADQPVEVELTGATQTIVPKRNRVYKCGELSSLTITDPPATGAYSIVFTSGATATATTIPATILGLESFAAEANTLYEINVLDNRALLVSWAVSA